MAALPEKQITGQLYKTDVQGLFKVRDGIVINKDNESLANYKKRKAKDAQINSLGMKVEALSTEMQELKQLLLEALKK